MSAQPMSLSTPHDDVLTVDHVSMRFGGLLAVDDLSFSARRGEITALIGPNGAGKTTVFNCITGFYKPTTGTIMLNQKSGKTFLLERMADTMRLRLGDSLRGVKGLENREPGRKGL